MVRSVSRLAAAAVAVVVLGTSLGCNRPPTAASGTTRPVIGTAPPGAAPTIVLCAYPPDAAPALVFIEPKDGLTVARRESPEAAGFASPDGQFGAGRFTFAGETRTISLDRPPAFVCNRRPGYFSAGLRAVPFLFEVGDDRVAGSVQTDRPGTFAVAAVAKPPAPPQPDAEPRFGAIDALFEPGTDELWWLSVLDDCPTTGDATGGAAGRRVRAFSPASPTDPAIDFVAPCDGARDFTLAFDASGRGWVRDPAGGLHGTTGPAPSDTVDLLEPAEVSLPAEVSGTPIGASPVAVAEAGGPRSVFVTRQEDGTCALFIVDGPDAEPRRLTKLDDCYEPLAFEPLSL